MAETSMRKYYLFAVKAFSDILATILVPALLALLAKYFLKLSPAMFFVVLSGAFIFTVVVLVRKIKQYGRSFQQLERTDEPRSTGGGTVV